MHGIAISPQELIIVACETRIETHILCAPVALVVEDKLSLIG